MDLRAYFQKVRKTEAEIPEESAVIVSLETGDGGTAGRLTEVTRSVAARMVVDGRARLATECETREFRQAQAKAYELVCERQARSVRGGVLSEHDLKAIRNTLRPGKQD